MSDRDKNLSTKFLLFYYLFCYFPRDATGVGIIFTVEDENDDEAGDRPRPMKQRPPVNASLSLHSIARLLGITQESAYF